MWKSFKAPLLSSSSRFCKIGALDESAIVLQRSCSVQCAHRPAVGLALLVAPSSHCTFFLEYLFKDRAFGSEFTQDVDHFHE
jgi:hypothetical protein